MTPGCNGWKDTGHAKHCPWYDARDDEPVSGVLLLPLKERTCPGGLPPNAVYDPTRLPVTHERYAKHHYRPETSCLAMVEKIIVVGDHRGDVQVSRRLKTFHVKRSFPNTRARRPPYKKIIADLRYIMLNQHHKISCRYRPCARCLYRLMSKTL